MSTKSASSSSSISLLLSIPEYYRIVFLNTVDKQNTLLMHYANGEWDLPYFEYPDGNIDGTLIPSVCNDFKSWLGLVGDHMYFTGTVELLGDVCDGSKLTPDTIGRAQLLLVEIHGIEPADINLPNSAKWKTVQFASDAFLGPESRVTGTTGKILKCLKKSSFFLESLSDARYRPGWFERASLFLVNSLSRNGAQTYSKVMQQHMSCTSTLLRVSTSLGNYFLKSPASGCNETAITAILAELFPNVCPAILGTSEELNCFVSHEFDHEEPEDIRDAVLALGRLQVKSVEKIECLVEAGCPVRNIEELPERSREWPQRLANFNSNPERFTQVLPIIEELSTELKGFKIPMTLVHGDFNPGNIGFEERNGCRDLILFDWEYAYIGHPFFDFRRFHEQIPENVREEYLELWSSFEDIDRVRRAYMIAKKLGWVMKLWSMLEWAERCNAQHQPLLSSNALNLAAYCYNVLFLLSEK